MMKKAYFAPVLFLLISTHAWGQTTYSGELIAYQGDFRQFDIFGAGPVTGSISGNTLTISSQGGKYTYQGYQDPKYTLDWSISLDKNAASAMTTGTSVTTYQGNFVYGQTTGSQSLTGAGQVNGSTSNGTLTLQTYNGRMGVNGVNPTNTTTDDWNTAAFNWNMSMPTSAVRSWLGL
jgi:hypothetical protein